MRLPYQSTGSGNEESLNQLLADRVQQQALLGRISSQRRLLQGSGYGLLSTTDMLGGGSSFSPLAGSQGMYFPPGDFLSLLASGQAIPTAVHVPSVTGPGSNVSDLIAGGVSHAQTASGHQLAMPHEYLQQYSSAQLQLLRATGSSSGLSSGAPANTRQAHHPSHFP